MMRVLIVDDEILVRVGLGAAIDWPANGFEIIGEAGNGKEALKKLMEGNVDILLTDIKMPVMDGIELMKNIKQNELKVKTIVLSCYDEYEYVREALKLGATDYLLKLSLNPENLLHLLLELKKEIESSSAVSFDDKAKRTEENWMRLLYQFSNNVWEELCECGIHLKEGNIAVFVVVIDSYTQLREQGKFKDENLLKSSVKGILNNILNDYAIGDCFAVKDGKFVAVINTKIDEHSLFLQIAANIQDALKRYFQITASIGISDVLESPRLLNTAYSQAYEALNKSLSAGSEIIGFFSDIKESQREDIRKAIEYIVVNYNCGISVSKVAYHVNMSENYFSHLFKKEIGEGFTEYVTKFRLEKAKELLKSSELKVNEIADVVGFENIYYFSKVFKKTIGISPKEYRKEKKSFL